jgi:hypothetical protein
LRILMHALLRAKCHIQETLRSPWSGMFDGPRLMRESKDFQRLITKIGKLKRAPGAYPQVRSSAYSSSSTGSSQTSPKAWSSGSGEHWGHKP